MKAYVLFLYLCCQSPTDRQEISVSSPERAAIIMWEKNQGGNCYSGKLVEYTLHAESDEIREIPIPQITFNR